MLSFDRFQRGRQRHAEPKVDPTVRGFVPVAVGCADAVGGTAPATAAPHVVLPGWRTAPVRDAAAGIGAVPIEAPFTCVPQHVVKSPGIGGFGRDGPWAGLPGIF